MPETTWPPRELVESNVDQEFLAFLRPVSRPLLAFTSGHFPAGSVSIPHSHPCPVLHGCLHGPIDLVMPSFRQTLESGQLFLLPANLLHHWESRCEGTAATMGLLVDAERPGVWPDGFGVESCCRDLLGLVDRPRLFSTADDPDLHPCYWQAADLLTGETPCSRLAVNSALWRLLTLLVSRMSQPSLDAVSNESARRIRRVLLTHLHDSPTLSEIAKECNLSVTRAKEVFAATYGCGIKDYLTQMKLFRAERLLGDSTLSVQQVSQRLGFSSQAYFSRLFRSRTGESPKQFRLRLKNHTHQTS